jgi:hypothetical protein
MKGDWSGRWELLPEGRNLSKSIGKLDDEGEWFGIGMRRGFGCFLD